MGKWGHLRLFLGCFYRSIEVFMTKNLDADDYREKCVNLVTFLDFQRRKNRVIQSDCNAICIFTDPLDPLCLDKVYANKRKYLAIFCLSLKDMIYGLQTLQSVVESGQAQLSSAIILHTKHQNIILLRGHSKTPRECQKCRTQHIVLPATWGIYHKKYLVKMKPLIYPLIESFTEADYEPKVDIRDISAS